MDTVKKAVVNKLGTTTSNGELYITHKLAGDTDVLETQIPKATTSTPGIMSKDDKDKLDKLSPNYPLVSQTINGESYNVATDEDESLTIYAPTEAGQEGYILASTGSGAPQWIPQADIKSGDSDHAKNADNATKASQDSMGRVISETYLTKEELGDIGTTAQEAKNISEQASRDVAAQESTIADIQETIENIAASGGATNAASVTYNSAGGSLTSTNVQNALTEVAGRLDTLDTANSKAVKDSEISEVRHIVNGVEYKTIVPSGETNNMDFVAPTEAGTQGHILQSSGDKRTAPTWADPADFKVGSASNADNAARLGNVEASKYVKKTDLTEATTDKAGLMSAADKTKLDNLSEGGEDPLEGYNLVSMTVNGDSFNVLSDSNEAPTIYTPTEEGWENAVMMADGDGMPYWADQTDLHVGSADSATNATNATKATSATKAISDGNGNNIVNTYATKTALNEVKVLVGDRDATSERMGYVILDPNKTFAEQVTEENTIYEIRDKFGIGGINYTTTLNSSFTHSSSGNKYYVTSNYITVLAGNTIYVPNGFCLFDSSKTTLLGTCYSPTSTASVYIAALQGSSIALGAAASYMLSTSFEMPKNCVLKFEGGKLYDGVLKGNNTVIESNNYAEILTNVICDGSYINEYASLCWFGAKSGFYIDGTTHKVQKYDTIEAWNAFSASKFKGVYVPAGLYYTSATIVFQRAVSINMAGKCEELIEIESLLVAKRRISHAVVWTDKDICVFTVRGAGSQSPWGTSLSIEGGVIDVSKCLKNYTKQAIRIEVCDGLNINSGSISTTIIGYNHTEGLESQGSVGVEMITTGSNYAHVWHLILNNRVRGFSIATRLKKNDSAGNWINGIRDYSQTVCPQAFVSENIGDYCRIDCEVQCGHYFSESNSKNYPAIVVGGLNNEVTAKVWDFRANSGGKYSNYYAVEVSSSARNTYISRNLQELYTDVVKGQYNEWYKKFNSAVYQHGYDDINNFFIDNPYLSYNIETIDCSITSTYTAASNLFNPNTKQSLAITKNGTNPSVKITVNLADKNQWDERFRVFLVGMTMTAFKNSYFSRIVFEWFEGNTLRYTDIQAVRPEDSGTYVRYFSSQEDSVLYPRCNKFVITLDTPNSGFSQVNICEVFGKTELYTSRWFLTSAGGEMYGKYTRNGKTYIDPKAYTALSELPVNNIAVGATAEVNGFPVIYSGGSWGYVGKDSASSSRPSSPYTGMCFFDTTLGKPIWWKGTAWVDATGATV